ncbi:MlaD family protein [uncultured Paludibaculum sp.]|uniref:MlaD family protein n=1 Tax=uncultured Paludibaculum sp. TaxID=1765020 RepID=UPI002AAC09CB|nr:MlaD family protein [uncultured Paludibaculum sp.]
MPASKKVAWSQLRVGIMSLVALVLLAVLIFLMTGADNPFEEKAFLYTYLQDSAAMTDGSAVRLNGILIGKLKKIELTGSTDNSRAIRMTMAIDKRFLSMIPNDSIVGFSAENVLGAKFLNIRRGASPVAIRSGGELKARDEKDFLEIVQSAMPLLDSVQSILGRIDKVVSQVESGKGSIGKLLFDSEIYDKVNGIMGDAQKITKAMSEGKGTIGHLLYDEGLYNDLRQTLTRMDNLVAGLERGEGTAGRLLKDPALFDELKKSTADLHVLLADLNAGKGTAGKLLKDEALHNKLVATLDRINTTIDSVNSGRGTLGQLMVNPALYQNLTATTAEIQGMMKDFRANPKKFLTIQLKLF